MRRKTRKKSNYKLCGYDTETKAIKLKKYKHLIARVHRLFGPTCTREDTAADFLVHQLIKSIHISGALRFQTFLFFF